MTAVTVPDKINRREFLNYVLGASVGLLAVEACGVAALFALPHKQEGVDYFRIPLDAIPAINAMPILWREAQLLLCQTSDGLYALNPTCYFHRLKPYTVKWTWEQKFQCPYCAGYYSLSGEFLGNGPACQDLNSYEIQVRSDNGILTTPPDGGGVSLVGAKEIIVDYSHEIRGRHSKVDYCGPERPTPELFRR